MKIRKPKELNGEGRYNSHTLNEILPYLPDQDCFFDSRHWVCETTDGILPFALTTKVSSNSQQYLKIYEKKGTHRTDKIIIAGDLRIKGWHNKANEVLDINGVSTCLHCQSNNLLQKILLYED